MKQEGFIHVFLVALIALIGIGAIVIFSLRNNSGGNISTYLPPPSSTDVQIQTTSVSPLPTQPAATHTAYTPATIDKGVIKITSPGVSRYYLFTITYDWQEGDKIDLIPSYAKDLYLGFTLSRGKSVLNINPETEGIGAYYDTVPDNQTVENSKLTTKTITRIMRNNTYAYVTYFGVGADGCSQWNPLPAACSLPHVTKDSGIALSVSCKSDNVSVCDEIFQSLDIQSKALE